MEFGERESFIQSRQDCDKRGQGGPIKGDKLHLDDPSWTGRHRGATIDILILFGSRPLLVWLDLYLPV